MADNNFARSGTADTDLLADDDPLSELARIVGYDPRTPVPAVEPVSEPVHVVARRQEPAFGLEDELMREFELYDAPRLDPVDHVSAPEPEPELHAPARYDEPEASARYAEPVFEEPVFDEPSFEAPAEMPVYESDQIAPFEEETVAYHDVPSVDDEPAAQYAPETYAASDAGHDGEEPYFEDSALSIEQPSYVTPVEPEPVFLGLQPADAHDDPLSGIDLERELELSIGDAHVDVDPVAAETLPMPEVAPDLGAYGNDPQDVSVDIPDLALELAVEAEAAFITAQPVVASDVETHVEPVFEAWTDGRDAAFEDVEPFRGEVAYGEQEPRFAAESAPETAGEYADVGAESDGQQHAAWSEPADGDAAFHAQTGYDAIAVAKGSGYDLDELLAEVERFPVPEARSPLAGVAAVATPRAVSAASSFFSRATPVANRTSEPSQPVAVAAEPEAAPILEPETAPIVEEAFAPAEAQASPAAEPADFEPDMDFENFELDLSDIELDLDSADFSLEDMSDAGEPAVQEAVPQEPVEVVRHEPVTAAPVSVFTTPRQAAAHPDAASTVLPFDPSMIADTEERVTQVTELDVPQLPVVEKEKPPVLQPDYDLDIDAEMAQLFAGPQETGARGDALMAGAAAVSLPQTSIGGDGNEVDDFEKALEEDFRRSLNQPERMAIPLDAGQAGSAYAGDGYGEERTGRGRGALIAASVIALLLLGGGGVYAWTAFGGSSANGSGEPRVILADKDPVKIVPEERGGKTVPNQDKAVYDRVAGGGEAAPQQEQLVTSTEEPIDVVQRTLTPENLPFDGLDEAEVEEAGRLLPGVDEPEAGADDGRAPLVSPRKVRTMIVKPDGTLVAREETVSEPEVEVAGIGTAATATVGEDVSRAVEETPLSTEQAEATEGARSALADVANADVEETAPVRVVRTTTVGNGETATDGGAPVPETRPVEQPVTVVGTVTDQGNLAAPATAETVQRPAEEVQVAAANPGGYLVQIASLPSEAEARKSYDTLSSRFSGVIGGRGLDIQRAEIPGKGTFFRVRIPGGSREEANALCTRYKSAGGSCLVTR